MSTQSSPTDQLAALGFRLVTGRMRFGVALSLGQPVYAKDQDGALLKFESNNGVISVSDATNEQLYTQVELQVVRTHTSVEAS